MTKQKKHMKTWNYYVNKTVESEKVATQFNLRPLLAQILLNRGINDVDKFLDPKLNYLNDPFEIPDIEKAARRVLLAKERGEKVLVYGDYDVDGVTGTTLLVKTLEQIGIKAEYYIPHRYDEGYSLSVDAVKKIAAKGTNLIITVDCGISAAKEITLANSLGMEVVITDHHNLPEKLPVAFAIVNPKQLPAGHPSRNLAGVGVAFKFVWALLRTAGIRESAFLMSLLDLVALGTFADVVPLTAENRILAVHGLSQLAEKKRLGLRYLADAAGINGKISINQVHFGLAPRINAAGRLEHASKSVDLFLTDDPIVAKSLAQELSRINSRRQDIGTAIKEEVFALIDDNYVAENKVIVLAGANWHSGVIGIVASKVAETRFRPTILIGIGEGVGRGSARSFNGFNIYEILAQNQDLFLDFGGHEGAAGFAITIENIPVLQARIKEQADKTITPEDMVPKISIDAKIEPAEITLGLVKELDVLAPYGEGNQQPVFVTEGLRLADYKKVGKEGQHLKAWFTRDGVRLETIAFGLGHIAESFNYQKKYSIAYKLESNEFNGFETAQLSLVDIREE
ncbi:MAG: single-stranded-DNA-specific exonuclease RecJ [bacterium]